jgi:hypothetical protein
MARANDAGPRLVVPLGYSSTRPVIRHRQRRGAPAVESANGFATPFHSPWRLSTGQPPAISRQGITCVLDWELSAVGNPIADLAYGLLLWEPYDSLGRVAPTSVPGFTTVAKIWTAIAPVFPSR